MGLDKDLSNILTNDEMEVTSLNCDESSDLLKWQLQTVQHL